MKHGIWSPFHCFEGGKGGQNSSHLLFGVGENISHADLLLLTTEKISPIELHQRLHIGYRDVCADEALSN